MNREDETKLLELYRNGNSSLADEESLTESFGDSLSGDKVWFSFIKHYRKRAPEYLENEVKSYIFRNTKGRRLLIRLASVAAILIFLISLVVLVPGRQKEMDPTDKMALIEEAYKLINSNQGLVSEDEIIYEDETIVIYFK